MRIPYNRRAKKKPAGMRQRVFTFDCRRSAQRAGFSVRFM